MGSWTGKFSQRQWGHLVVVLLLLAASITGATMRASAFQVAQDGTVTLFCDQLDTAPSGQSAAAKQEWLENFGLAFDGADGDTAPQSSDPSCLCLYCHLTAAQPAPVFEPVGLPAPLSIAALPLPRTAHVTAALYAGPPLGLRAPPKG